MEEKKPEVRQKRVLAKPLIQAGRERRPGEEVLLRPDQIERLGQSFFKPAGGK